MIHYPRNDGDNEENINECNCPKCGKLHIDVYFVAIPLCKECEDSMVSVPKMVECMTCGKLHIDRDKFIPECDECLGL